MAGLAHLAARVFLLTAVATPNGGAAVDDVVQHVQERFDATRDFTATVDQELVVTAAGRSLTAHGTVTFKRPGKMRWTLQNDEPHVIVSDGSTLWFYQPDEQQVLKAPFRSAFRSTTPVSFLTGVGRIRDDFDVSLDGTDDGHVLLALVPRNGGEELGRLRLTVETNSYDIVAAEVRDPAGNVTRLRFSNLRRNRGVDDALFRFEVPPGVDVIEAPIGY